MKKIILCLFLLNNSLFSNNKIIFLVSPPRSLSVAFLRMMEAYNEFIVMNEPFIASYALLTFPDPEFTKTWWRPEAPKTYTDAKEQVLSFSNQKPVFVKEMSWAAADFLTKDPDFITNPNIHFIFLVRNPHPTIISYYNGLKQNPFETFSFHVGYESCYTLFKKVLDMSPNKPGIIRAEDLYTNPSETAKALCDYLNVPFKPEMLYWKNLGNHFEGYHEWNDAKQHEYVQHWHQHAIHSTGISKPTEYEIDKLGNPTFSEIKNDNHKKLIQEAYFKNLMFYQYLLEYKEYLLGK